MVVLGPRGGGGRARLGDRRRFLLSPSFFHGVRKSGPGHKLVDDGVSLEPTAAPRQRLVTLDDLLKPSRCLCDLGLEFEGLVPRVWLMEQQYFFPMLHRLTYLEANKRTLPELDPLFGLTPGGSE